MDTATLAADAKAGIATARRTAVSVRGVSMIYSGQAAVDDVSFDVAEGTFLTLLGPSGSGKTTLLRMIAGFQQPTRGEILVGGVSVADLPPWRRSIGMVFQRLALFPHMTAAENIAFPLKMRRFDARTIPDRVERYLGLVKLSGYGGRRIHELSGGQQQRVAIARALVFEPDLLLLDEPLAALDRKLREEMQLEFRTIQHELGVTTINVTHDQREALVVSDEIIVMDGGRVQQIADPRTLYRRPANRFVAGFLGVSDFLEGVARPAGSGPGIEVAGSRLPCQGAALADGEPAVAAIRAEQIRVAGSEAGLADLDTRLPAEVADAIFEGERIVYELRLPGLGGVVLRAIAHDPESHEAFSAGDRVAAGWNRRDLVIFPRT